MIKSLVGVGGGSVNCDRKQQINLFDLLDEQQRFGFGVCRVELI